MTTVDPTNNTPFGASNPSGPGSPPPYSQNDTASTTGWDKFKNYLGPKNYAVFQANVCKAITDQIKHLQQRAQKASQQLKRSETGQDIYDD